MFTSVGVKIHLDHFLTICKKTFRNFETDLAKYTTEWLKENKNEDEKYATIEFLGDKANHYFSTSNIENENDDKIVIFEWCPERKNGDVKSTIVVFGISLLVCDREDMKSTSVYNINACIEEMKILIKLFEIDESKIELIVDAI
jgi:hypothetical protein